MAVSPTVRFVRAAVAVWLLFASSPAWTQGQLQVQFISVGQADATLIRCPTASGYMLIDSGDRKKGGYPNSPEDFQKHVLQELNGKTKALDIVVASHVHADHIGSLPWIFDTFTVKTYVDNGDHAETDTFKAVKQRKRKLVQAGRLEYINAKQARSMTLTFCPNEGVSVHVFSPAAYSKKLRDANDKSVIVRVDHKNVSFLFVGDAHDKAEKAMLEHLDDELRKKLDVDVLKVGHHGSHTSSTAEFVMAVSPELAVISSGRRGVGTNERYKHPRASTITTYTNWFAKLEAKKLSGVRSPGGKVWAYEPERKWRQMDRPNGLLLTPVDGTITMRSDGQKLSVRLAVEEP